MSSFSSLNIIEAIDAIDRYLENKSTSKSLDSLLIVEVPSNILPPGKVYLGRHNFLFISDQPSK